MDFFHGCSILYYDPDETRVTVLTAYYGLKLKVSFMNLSWGGFQISYFTSFLFPVQEGINPLYILLKEYPHQMLEGNAQSIWCWKCLWTYNCVFLSRLTMEPSIFRPSTLSTESCFYELPSTNVHWSSRGSETIIPEIFLFGLSMVFMAGYYRFGS